ncbi:MAG: DUF1445 domain-containing protein [Moraxellaceae bacterium]|nr:DUF1445 domain-containing protein [Moraxellaceae bacterium]
MTHEGVVSAAQRFRQAVRAGVHDGLTTGCAQGFVQANLVLLPQRHAHDFLGFCAANAAACPVLAVGQPGDVSLPGLGEDIDLRRDLPGYHVYRGGRFSEARRDVRDLWQDDLVGVAIGCWFSMEDALREAGVRLRHVELGIQGPLFRTNVRARSFGRMQGPLVVSMRPFRLADVATVRSVSARYPRVHGAPIHEGDPAVLGITDLHAPDFGEVLLPLPGEQALYWGCGLTAVCALQTLQIDFITHAPGRMLVTDLLNQSLAETEELP